MTMPDEIWAWSSLSPTCGGWHEQKRTDYIYHEQLYLAATPARLRAEALEEENKRLQTQVGRLMTAIGWLIPPFVDENTPEAELRQRVKFCLADADRALLGKEKADE